MSDERLDRDGHLDKNEHLDTVEHLDTSEHLVAGCGRQSIMNQRGVRRPIARRRWPVIALVVALMVASVAGGLGWRDRARLQRSAQRSQALHVAQSAQLVTATDPALALLLAVESIGTDDTVAGRRAALGAASLLSSPRSRLVRSARDPVQLTTSVPASASIATDLGLMAVGTVDGGVQIFDSESLEPVSRRLSAFDGPVTEVAVGANGWVAAIGPDRELAVWDASFTRIGPFRLSGSGEFVTLAWLSDFEVVIGSRSGVIEVVDVENGQRARPPIELSSSQVQTVTVLAEDRAVVAVEEGSVSILNLESAEVDSELDLRNATVTASASDADRRLLASAENGALRVWDIDDGEVIAGPIGGSTGIVTALAFSSGGTLLAVGTSEKTVRIWDPHTGDSVSAPLSDLGAPVAALAFTPEADAIVAISDGGQASRWEIEELSLDEEPRRLPSGMPEVRDLAFSPDGELLVAVGRGGSDGEDRAHEAAEGEDAGRVVVLDPRSGDVVHELVGHEGVVSWAAFASDGTLATAGHDGTVRLWDVETGAQVGTPLTGHEGPVLSVEFDPRDADRLVSSGADGSLRRWSRSTGEETGAPITGHGSDPDPKRDRADRRDVVSVSFNHDGSLLASAGVDHTARIWETESWNEDALLAGHRGPVGDAVFDPTDSGVVFTAGSDETIRAWDIPTGQELDRFSGPGAPVVDLVALVDGSALISSGGDNAIRLWDIGARTLLGTPLERHDDPLRRMALHPDQRVLASAGLDGQILLWPQVDVDLDALVVRACDRAAGRSQGPDLTAAEWERYVGVAKDQVTRCS